VRLWWWALALSEFALIVALCSLSLRPPLLPTDLLLPPRFYYFFPSRWSGFSPFLFFFSLSWGLFFSLPFAFGGDFSRACV
jgi:hypothetical protein